jgi:uncharacterized damage-inducible protein DinB
LLIEEETMETADIRHLFDYTEWANALVLDAAAKLDDEQLRREVQISHGSIFGTLLHMAGAEWIWLERWHGHSPQGADAWALWKAETCPDLTTLNQRWHELIGRRAEFIATLSQSQLLAELPFTLISGEASVLPLVGQMQHVVNHATLHRGQVVGMIRQMGITPPATDLLFYLRAGLRVVSSSGVR